MLTLSIILIGIMIACTPSMIFMAIVLWKDHQDQQEDRRRGWPDKYNR